MTAATKQLIAEPVAYDKARSNLKWVVRYRDGTGRRRRKSFRYRSEAVAFRKTLVAEVKFHPEHEPTTFLEVGKCFERTLQDYNRHQKTEAALRLHLYPEFGETWLNEIDAEFQRAVLDHIEALPVGASHRYLVRKAFEETLRFSRDRGLMPGTEAHLPKKRPATTPGLVARALSASRKTMPTLEEVDRLLQGATDWLRVPVHLALRAGLRLGEILALRWSDIHFDTREIEVRSSEPKPRATGNGADLARSPPKTRSGHRFAPMTRKLAVVLRWWRRQVVAEGTNKVVLRPYRSHRPLTRAVLSREFFRLQVKLRMAREERKPSPVGTSTSTSYPGHYSFHQLRHAYVAILIWGRVPDAQISAAVGHKTIKITLDMYGYLIKLRNEGAGTWPGGQNGEPSTEAEAVGTTDLIVRHGRTYRVYQRSGTAPVSSACPLAA